LRNREKLVGQLLLKADRMQEHGENADSFLIYQRVLAIDPENERAHAGVERYNREVLHANKIKASADDLENKNRDTAREKLTEVVRENPKNVQAVKMLKSTEVKAPAMESLLSTAYKTPISISFKDAPLKQVFDVIAQTSGLNILFDKDVKLDQKTSLFLKNSTIEAAIYYLLLTNRLEQQVMDANTLLIYPNSADKQKDYQQLIVKMFLISNAKASALAETLKTLLKLHDVVVDDKLNMIIVRDNPDALRLAEKLIATQDVPEPEVMLEVEILEVSRDKLLNLGVDLPGSMTFTPLAAAGGAVTVDTLRHITGKTLSATVSPAVINANKTDKDADILANPRIRVLNREKAKIMIGNKVPSITATAIPTTGAVVESVTYLDVGLKLEVEPTIYLDNDVAIRVGLEVSSIVSTQTSAAGTVSYTMGNRTANTMLRLKDGENQVLAGLINNEERNTAKKLPGLGDLPLLGRLFGTNQNQGVKTEIVLSITPHIIRNIKRPDAANSEFLSGTESSMRRRPDFSPKPAPIAPLADAMVAKPVEPAAPTEKPVEKTVEAPAEPVVVPAAEPVAVPVPVVVQ
jgi:general secretion pathway protein D